MTKILFGQSYFLKLDAKLWAAHQPYPPLGTLYAASYLRQRGYHVDLFDATLADSEEDWDLKLALIQPNIAVLYEDNFNYLSKMCLDLSRQAALKMIRMAKLRGCLVCVCSADATDHADLYLEAGVDFVLQGEGEQTLGELVNALAQKDHSSLENISGICFLKPIDGERKLVKTPRRQEIRNLDELPFPAWDLVEIEEYRKIWKAEHGYFSMNIITTRGCPFHCNWCAKPIWGQHYNTRSPENVIREMVWLRDHYQPDHFWIADDIFGLKPGWLERFAKLKQIEHLTIPFKCLSRADLLNRAGDVEALARAGAEIVWMGAESGAQEILDAMEKGTTVEQIILACSKLRSAGIRVGLFLQFGFPGENLPQINSTIRLIRDIQPDDIGVSVAYPMPGTKFYESVRSQLRDKQNWSDSADLAMLYNGPFSTLFYRQLHKVVHGDFRLRQIWSERIASGKGPGRENNGKLFVDIAKMLFLFCTLPYERIKLWFLAKFSKHKEIMLDHMPRSMSALPSKQDN